MVVLSHVFYEHQSACSELQQVEQESFGVGVRGVAWATGELGYRPVPVMEKGLTSSHL